MRPGIFILSAVITLSAASAALAHDPPAAKIGEPGDAAAVTRTIEVRMQAKMQFSPASIRVRGGETVRLVLTNTDDRTHEFMLGEIKELRAHAAVMQKHPEMIHDEPNAITVAAGQTGELIWKFPKSGRVDFACLLPGHFEAGMKGAVQVSR